MNLLLFLLLIACVSITGAWVAENPGYVTLYWYDWRVDTSAAFLLLLMLAATLAILVLMALARRLILAPGHMSRRRSVKYYRLGLDEITRSIAALAAADPGQAQQHARKAERCLGDHPITLLITAQIARNEGDEAKTHLLLERMLEHEETEYLAARLLSESAARQQRFVQAERYAQRAHAANPQETASATTLIGVLLKQKKWQEALTALDGMARKGRMRHADRLHLKGLIQLEHGEAALEEKQYEAALASARQCLKYLTDFPPAITFAARALQQSGQTPKAVKLILKKWKIAPHPQLSQLLLEMSTSLPKTKQLKLMRKLPAILPSHAESHLALAQAALSHKEWDEARKAAKTALALNETRRACQLMADLEKGEFSDYDAAGIWLARSANANPDAGWICSACGDETARWNAQCQACHGFDTLTWKQRKLQFVGIAD